MSLIRHHCKTCKAETLHKNCACITCGTLLFEKPVVALSKKDFGTFGLKKPITKKRV